MYRKLFKRNPHFREDVKTHCNDVYNLFHPFLGIFIHVAFGN